MTGPTIVAVLLGLVVLVAWPRHGVYARWMRFRELIGKERLEHALKHIHHCEYVGSPANLEGLAGVVGVSRDQAVHLLDTLTQAGLVEVSGGQVRLTTAGRREALRIIRIHRLWEKYFAERTGLDETLWHEEADRREHLTSSEKAEQLAEGLGHPRFDPHGAPIPTQTGDLPGASGVLLSELENGQTGRVLHVEDEPSALHEQLVVQGLSVGAVVRVVGREASSLSVEVAGEQQALAQAAAANVNVELIETPPPDGGLMRLARLPLGRKARVIGLLASCHGIQRRRLLDLGLITGTIVEPELASAAGDPTAYRIRGALVALRRDQATQIEVEPMAEEGHNGR